MFARFKKDLVRLCLNKDNICFRNFFLNGEDHRSSYYGDNQLEIGLSKPLVDITKH
jgi:hypothetical protein